MGKAIKRIVPWYSMKEWLHVYKCLFSDSISEKSKGYEILLAWKARISKLPSGVECTLNLVEVQLADESNRMSDKAFGSGCSERDIQLMYSTSILRFLSHIAMLSTSKDNLYQVARKMKIPDWIVRIRHDCAHNINLPPLNLLRAASHFGLNWIHEHYWRNEANHCFDWVKIPNVSAREYKKLDVLEKMTDSNFWENLLDIWQSLQLYSLCQYQDLDSIPDKDLINKFFNCISIERRNEPNRKKRKLSPANSDFEVVYESKEEEQVTVEYKKGLTTTAALSKLRKLASTYIGFKKNDEEMFKKLVISDAFLPSPYYLDAIRGEDDICFEKLPPNMLLIWKPILQLFYDNGLFPSLIERLHVFTCASMELDLTQRYAALWIKELTKIVSKMRYIVRMNGLERKLYAEGKINFSLYHVQKAELEKPEMKSVLHFNEAYDKNKITVDEARKYILDFNKWTSVYIYDVLDIVEPAISSQNKENLMNLLDLYSMKNVMDIQVEEENVYTIESLNLIQNLDIQNNRSEVSEIQSSPWSLCDDVTDWGQSPLGVLPWQLERDEVNFDLPDGNWRLKGTKPEVPKLAQITTGEIDWKKIQRRRLRRLRVKKGEEIKRSGISLNVVEIMKQKSLI